MFPKCLPTTAALVLALAIVAMAQSEGVPAFHQAPPKPDTPLAPIVPKAERKGEAYAMKFQQAAYEVAQKIPAVLYQMPCYCYCDRIGHNSLRSCFESAHGAHCATCMKEAFFAYFQTRRGKTPKQIREGIIKGEWQALDLEQSADRARKM